MKLIAHTQYGVFESKTIGEEQYSRLSETLHSIHKTVNFCFELSTGGMIYFTKEMIANTLFILEK